MNFIELVSKPNLPSPNLLPKGHPHRRAITLLLLWEAGWGLKPPLPLISNNDSKANKPKNAE
jgi:hypothetical protein